MKRLLAILMLVGMISSGVAAEGTSSENAHLENCTDSVQVSRGQSEKDLEVAEQEADREAQEVKGKSKTKG